jgi:hypothetical protein
VVEEGMVRCEEEFLCIICMICASEGLNRESKS